MPATGIRCTFFFQEDIFGFTETHVLTAVTDPALARQPCLDLLKKRLLVSGPPVECVGIRMSQLGVFRSFLNITPDQIGNTESPPVIYGTGGDSLSGPNDADQPKSCVLLKMDHDSKTHRNMYLAGIPDIIIGEDPKGVRFGPVATWYKAYKAWVAQLIKGNWGFVAKAPNVPPTDQKAVKGVTFNNVTNQVGVYLPTVGGAWIQGALLQLQGFTRTNVAYASLNGKWAIASVQADSPVAGQSTYYLLNSSGVPISQIVKFGTAQLYDTQAVTYVDVGIESQTTRKRGNRFLVPLGRRKTIKRLSS